MSPNYQPLLSSLFFTCLGGRGGGREAAGELGGRVRQRWERSLDTTSGSRSPRASSNSDTRKSGAESQRRHQQEEGTAVHAPSLRGGTVGLLELRREDEQGRERRQHRREESMAACAIPHSVICADTAGLTIVASWDTTSGESGKREGTNATSPPPLSATSTCRGTSTCALLGFWASSGFLSTARWTSNFSSVMASQPTPHLAHTSSSSFAHASSEPLYVSSLLPPQPPHCPSPCRR